MHIKITTCSCWAQFDNAQFYVQLVYRPQCGTQILLFWPFGQLRAVREKSGFELFWATFEGGFFQLFVVKKKSKYIYLYVYFDIKSYIKWLLHIYIFFCFVLFWPQKFEKIGYHSNIFFERNTERGYIDSLSIALGDNGEKARELG